MTGRHEGAVKVAPRVGRAVPEHRMEHVHEFRTVAEFDGIRASIGECSCGETRTIWRVPERVVYDVSEACRWWALCTRPATRTIAHPILGDVPICDECAAKVAAL